MPFAGAVSFVSGTVDSHRATVQSASKYVRRDRPFTRKWTARTAICRGRLRRESPYKDETHMKEETKMFDRKSSGIDVHQVSIVRQRFVDYGLELFFPFSFSVLSHLFSLFLFTLFPSPFLFFFPSLYPPPLFFPLSSPFPTHSLPFVFLFSFRSPFLLFIFPLSQPVGSHFVWIHSLGQESVKRTNSVPLIVRYFTIIGYLMRLGNLHRFLSTAQRKNKFNDLHGTGPVHLLCVLAREHPFHSS